MNYSEALEYIHGTYKFGVKLGLENIRKLLELLGNPHKKLKFVHVAVLMAKVQLLPTLAMYL